MQAEKEMLTSNEFAQSGVNTAEMLEKKKRKK